MTAALAKAPDLKTRSKTVQVKGLFLPYQVDRITAPWRYLFDEKARRVGLTYAYAYRYARKRAVHEGKTWYTANDAGTVLEFIDYVGYFGRLLNSAFEEFDDALIVDGNEILTKVVRFKLGGQINGLSSNANALHGKGGDWIGDEFSRLKPENAAEMWEAGRQTALRGDDTVILSTHTTVESYYNRLLLDARKVLAAAESQGIAPSTPEYYRLALSMKTPPWLVQRTDIFQAVEQGLVEQINKTKGLSYTREDFLAECRAGCKTEDQWKRQFLCEPSSDSTALLPYNLMLTCAEDQCLRDPAGCTGDLYQGMDIGRRNNPTIIGTGEKLGDVLWTRKWQRMRGVPFREQLSAAERYVVLPNFRTGCYDQTGMGEMPVEEMQRRHGSGRVQGINFTAGIKNDMAMALRRAFEDRTIRIPNDPELLDRLNSVRCTTTATGAVRYEAEADDEEHGDDFWALALMNWSASRQSNDWGATLIR
jgi:phage FluMu gp28-like protein